MSKIKDRLASAKTALRRSLDVRNGVAAGIENQPVSSITWVDPTRIRPTPMNPNYVAPPELRLLKISLLSDGWTQPLVVSEIEDDTYDFEITDGEHRHIVGQDPEVAALTNGKVPVAILHPKTDEDRIMSTVRHNRARGSHHVMSMADIVATLHGAGVSEEDIGRLLQMESEEVSRFLDRGDMVKRGVGETEEFNQGWVPR